VKPTVLIATTCGWFPPARLAMAMGVAGCTVDALCPARHPLARMSVVRKTHTYRGLMPLKSFEDAISAMPPDLIVPGDDLATAHLQRLYEREKRRADGGRSVCELIERSLGSSESFPVVYARAAFMEMASQENIRAPKTGVIENIDDLKTWVAQTGFPIVLKANGTSGGDGVRVAHTLEQAERAFRTLQAPPLMARAAKRALVDQDKTLVWPSLLRRECAGVRGGERSNHYGRLLEGRRPRQPSFRGGEQEQFGGALKRCAFDRECRDVGGRGKDGASS
jgi:hypothetical protein